MPLSNTRLLVKSTVFFLLFAALQFCTPAPHRRVTVKGKGLSLEAVFTEIRKQTGLSFLYQSSLLKGARPVTLDVREMLVEEVLKICLSRQGLGFTIRNGTVVIYKLDDPARNGRSLPMNTAGFCLQSD